jgi:hypothetical protein
MATHDESRCPVIGIVGGDLAGTLTAVQLLRRASHPLDVVLLGPERSVRARSGLCDSQRAAPAQPAGRADERRRRRAGPVPRVGLVTTRSVPAAATVRRLPAIAARRGGAPPCSCGSPPRRRRSEPGPPTWRPRSAGRWRRRPPGWRVPRLLGDEVCTASPARIPCRRPSPSAPSAMNTWRAKTAATLARRVRRGDRPLRSRHVRDLQISL